MKLMDKLLYDERHKSVKSKHSKDKEQRAFIKLDQEISKIFEIENTLKEELSSNKTPQMNKLTIDFDQAFS